MASVTSFSAERMLAIENNSVVDGAVAGDDLILVRKNGDEINAGSVRGPQGIQGIQGPASVVICTRATRPGVGVRYEGLLIYETDTDYVFAFNGTSWVYQSGVVICTSTTRPNTVNKLFEGLVIYETDTDRTLIYNGTAWIGMDASAGVRPSDFFSVNVQSGTATTYTTFLQQLSTFTTPVPIRQFITAHIHMGGNGGPLRADFRVIDRAGAAVNPGGGWNGTSRSHRLAAAAHEASVSLVNYKDYTAGSIVGFQLQYQLSASNLYFQADVKVDYEPLLS